jgi:hypothetical protein
MGRVDRKPDPQKNIVRLNMTFEPAPTGEIWHPNLNPSGFGSGSGAHRVLERCFFWVFFRFYFFCSFCFFQVSDFFQVPFGFFFQVLGFFQVSGAPAGEKRNPHMNPVLYGFNPWVKNEPKPAPVGSKTHR